MSASEEAKKLWEQLGNVGTDDDGIIDMPFLDFPAGTDREDIWHWFEETFNLSVAEDLMYHHDLTIKDVIDLMPKKYTLFYANYDDNLDNRLEEIQKSIHDQDWSWIDEGIDEWIVDAEGYSVNYAITELKDDVRRAYDIDEDEIDGFFEDNEEDIRDTIYERDDSTPMKDLIHNTGEPVCFYDLGFDVDSTCFMDEEDYSELLTDVKAELQIEGDNYDKYLNLMLCQASYGGRLVVYFKGDIEELIKSEGYNTITFRNPMIAVIDTMNGSGDHTDLENHTMKFAFEPKNIFLDRLIKYSYTYEVCGMYSNWCDCTSYKLTKEDDAPAVEKSSLNHELDREERYNKTYKEGGCTFGDMDYGRHRNMFYINDFPCGTKCPNCGTFFID